MGSVRLVDLTTLDETSFVRRFVGCIVISYNGRILLQHRAAYGSRFPDCLGTFGGGIEKDETPMGALIREMYEELGGQVDPAKVVKLGAVTESLTGHRELIYGYFWRDEWRTITGCYEGKIHAYDDCVSAFAHPKIMDDARWFLEECRRRELL